MSHYLTLQSYTGKTANPIFNIYGKSLSDENTFEVMGIMLGLSATLSFILWMMLKGSK
jgi:hypothetical protein